MTHRIRHTLAAVLLALAGTASSAAAPIDNGLARTPPMGWSSWNQFGEAIDERMIIETIDAMAAHGLRAAGYEYVNLDDGWQHWKAARQDKPLEADPVRFPHGIRYLADYAHARGFKLGLYSGPGARTCAGYTGSEGHETEDAAMFAAWGVDHLKYDSCCSHKDAPKAEVQRVVGRMSNALLATKRPIVYHACHCGWSDIPEWAAALGVNQWRIGQDISDDFNYPGLREKYYFDVLDMLDRGEKLAKFAGPGHWNDFDMLIVGLGGRSPLLVGTGASNVEYRTHFSLWAMLESPLLIGADVRALDADSLATLTNAEVIAVNQDPAGHAAEKVGEQGVHGELQVWAKEMADGSWVVALLNRGTATAEMNVSPRRDLSLPWNRYRVRDLWSHKDRGPYDIPYTVEVTSHEAKVLRLFPVEVGS